MTPAPPKNWTALPATGQNAGQQGFGVDYFDVRRSCTVRAGGFACVKLDGAGTGQ